VVPSEKYHSTQRVIPNAAKDLLSPNAQTLPCAQAEAGWKKRIVRTAVYPIFHRFPSIRLDGTIQISTHLKGGNHGRHF
jgi:hypothetical protein